MNEKKTPDEKISLKLMKEGVSPDSVEIRYSHEKKWHIKPVKKPKNEKTKNKD